MQAPMHAMPKLSMDLSDFLFLPDLGNLVAVCKSARATHRKAYKVRKLRFFMKLSKIQQWAATLEHIQLREHNVAHRFCEVRGFMIAYVGRPHTSQCERCLIERVEHIRYTKAYDLHYLSESDIHPYQWISGEVTGNWFEFFGLRRLGIPPVVYFNITIDGVCVLYETKTCMGFY